MRYNHADGARLYLILYILYLNSVHFYFRGYPFGFIAQRIEVAVQRGIAQYNTHTAIDAGGRLAEDTQVSIFFFGHLFHATVVGTLLTGNGRKNNGTRPYPLLLDTRNGQTEYGAAMQFEFVQVLCSSSVTMPVSCGRGESSEK